MQLTDGRLRRLARVAFVLCCAFYLVEALVPVLARAAWGQGWSWDGSPSDTAFSVMLFCFPLVGFLVARQQPRNAIGWIMLATGLIASLPTQAYATYGLQTRPGSLPAADVVVALTAATWAPILGLIATYLVLLFPDGHLPSSRWRPVAWFSGLAIAWVYLLISFFPGKLEGTVIPETYNPLGLDVIGAAQSVLLPTIIVLPISFVLCAAGLVARFRHSSGKERMQVKWLATAGAVVALLYAVTMVCSLTVKSPLEQDPQWLMTLQNLATFSFVLIPVAIGVAILKHGLYGIDVVINKAVVFATLASFITAVYVAIVVGIGRLAGGGDRPDLALSIAATSVVAVAFEPVRARVQRLANRLVYGERATPYEVLSEFTNRVGGSYETAELLPLMARTVAQGVGARSAEVWLATAAGFTLEATWTGAGEQQGGAEQHRRRIVPGIADLEADVVVPVRHQGEVLGALALSKAAGEAFSPAERKLLDDVAAQAGLVLRNVRLIEELRDSRERLFSTQDEERRRLERSLHEGAQKRLAAVAVLISTARARLDAGDVRVGSALDQLSGQLQTAMEELRELGRGIHPAVLTERGLGPAVRSLAERSPVPVSVDVQLDVSLSRAVEVTLYYVAAEALTNMAKYAHASRASVSLTRTRDGIVLEVSDDGIGGADGTRGSGIRGLRDRVGAVDGSFTVYSPPGGGTVLTCVVPQPVEPEPAPGPPAVLLGADA